MTTVDLGVHRRLQLVQGLQWLNAAHGDPFAALLCGFPNDDIPLPAGDIHHSVTGTWVTATHHGARAALADPAMTARFTGWRPGGVEAMPLTERDLGLDPANRAALTGAAEALRAQEGLRPRLAAACASSVTGLGERFDLAEAAQRIALATLAALLNRPVAELADLVPAAGRAADSGLCPQGIEPTERMLSAIGELRVLFDRHASGEPALALAVLGARLTADLLLGALAELLAAPARWAALRADPAMASGIVAETLRHSPPVRVQLMDVDTDTTIAGQAISPGEQVAVLLGPANRDATAFTDPDRFDPLRTTPATLLPRWPAELILPLVREQAEAGLVALAARLPGLAADGQAVRRPRAPVSRGLARLPVRTTAETSAS